MVEKVVRDCCSVSDPLTGLADVPWSDLRTAYGNAGSVPDMLIRLGSTDPAEADTGWDLIFQQILWHQGTVYSGTAAAVGFLAALSASERTHRRPRLISYLAQLSLGGDVPYSPAGTASQVRQAVRRSAPLLRPCLDTRTVALGYAMVELAAAVPLDLGDAGPLIARLRSSATPVQAQALAGSACLLGDDSADVFALLAQAQDDSRYVGRPLELIEGRELIERRPETLEHSGDGGEEIIGLPIYDEMIRWLAAGRPAEENNAFLNLLATVHELFSNKDVGNIIWTAP